MITVTTGNGNYILRITCDLCRIMMYENYVNSDDMLESARNSINICSSCLCELGINYLIKIKTKKQAE
jgi:hypothetical protein